MIEVLYLRFGSDIRSGGGPTQLVKQCEKGAECGYESGECALFVVNGALGLASKQESYLLS